MQRVRALGIKPFGDNPPPTVLTPNMLVLAPQLAHKYPDVYNQELFNKSMDTYGPRWGLDRATVLKTASNTAGGENQDNAANAPLTGQESAKRPDEDFTHNGIGYYRRNGQLYSAGSDDPNIELKVTPEVEAKIMKERAEQQPLEEQRQKSSEALKQRLEVYAPQWEENAVAPVHGEPLLKPGWSKKLPEYGVGLLSGFAKGVVRGVGLEIDPSVAKDTEFEKVVSMFTSEYMPGLSVPKVAILLTLMASGKKLSKKQHEMLIDGISGIVSPHIGPLTSTQGKRVLKGFGHLRKVTNILNK